MFLMIYAQLRLLYFCLGKILQEDSGGAALWYPGASLFWCSDSKLQTLTNELCETTAIDIYLISPHPTTVSTMSRLAIILFFEPSYTWCQEPPLLASPKGPPIGAPGQRREREKAKGRWRGEKVRLKALGIGKNTHFSVFSLVCLMNYLMHYTAEEKRTHDF